MLKLNILYVEDDKDTRESFSDLLEEYCSKLYVAKNGLEGLEIFKNNHIDIVLSDITMPKMNGLEMAEAIFDINENMYIIILSAYSDIHHLQKAINLGINNFLLKPIDIDKLEDSLNKITKQIKNARELEKLNQTLNARVQEEIEKNAKKDVLLLSQSKSSQMGELLSMITHQWRQPLNAISSSSISISLKNQMDTLAKEDINVHTEFLETQTQHMSKIINDFMDFFKPENNKKLFSIKELIHKIKYIIEAQLKYERISLNIIGEDIKIFSYENELSNVILNFISNSVDAFNDLEIDDKKIEISVIDKDNDLIEIIFKDNAGGIKEDKLDKVFDAYFTTKEQGKGTGIGLHMTKRIVNEVLDGDIYVSNVDNGAEFRIIIENS